MCIRDRDLAGNIRFYRELPQEELDRAARTAQADYIFEKGMGHPVAVRGNNLSCLLYTSTGNDNRFGGNMIELGKNQLCRLQ